MNPYFQKLKSNLELTESFDDVVCTRHLAVRSVIEKSSLPVSDTKLIGSLQRKTRIHPRENDDFDIDILIIMGEFTHWTASGGVSANDALYKLHSSVLSSDRYSTKNPEVDAPTISLHFADRAKVELVPAYIDNIGKSPSGISVPPIGRGYWVPKNGRWEHADYDFDAQYVTEQNATSDTWLVPTIKMLKAIRREHLSMLDSFPLEIMAAQTVPAIVHFLKKNNRQVSYPEILEWFFALEKTSDKSSLKMPNSNSTPVLMNALHQEAVNKTFQLLENHIRKTRSENTLGEQIVGWRVLFGDVFPTTI